MYMEVQTKLVTVDGIGSSLSSESGEQHAACPRCANDAPVRLEKADPMANTCYRCRTCGHIFSPRDD